MEAVSLSSVCNGLSCSVNLPLLFSDLLQVLLKAGCGGLLLSRGKEEKGKQFCVACVVGAYADFFVIGFRGCLSDFEAGEIENHGSRMGGQCEGLCLSMAYERR